MTPSTENPQEQPMPEYERVTSIEEEEALAELSRG